MEEDMKILEELLKASKENDMYEGNKYFKSLEYFIKEYQDLEEIEKSHRKENGELRERVKELEEENKKIKIEKISYLKELQDYTANEKCIPISLVKEKIEELKHKNFIAIQVCSQYDNKALTQIEILQELLEKRR